MTQWLSDAQLEALMNAESDSVEFKSSLSDKEEIKKTICALANDLPDHRQPGVVFVGLNGDGSCAGLSVTEEMERIVAGFRSEGNLLPQPSLKVERKVLRGCELLVVQVQPTDRPPMRLRGRTYVRVGSTRQDATPEEEKRLVERLRRNLLPFDHQPVPGATLDDLDMLLFEHEYLPQAVAPEILAANQRSPAQQLASLRLATPDGQPTYAGVLALGKDVRQWLPGAYIQFVRSQGKEIVDPVVDQKELDGPVSDIMHRLDELIHLHIRVPTQIVGTPIERRTPDYPSEALRQFVRNAVMHRSYEGTNAPVRMYWFSDRVEIHSPGGPYGQVNRENFGHGVVTDYRNPQLAEAMKVLGYVQRFGFGIPLAQTELAKNQNPLAEFTPESTHVLVIVRSRP